MGIIVTEKQYIMTMNKIKELKEVLKINKKNSFNDYGVEAIIYDMEHETNEFRNIVDGDIPERYYQLENIGLLLIALRIKNKFTQTELAKRLGVTQPQIARDERNEYFGVSIGRINSILNIYGISSSVLLTKQKSAKMENE